MYKFEDKPIELANPIIVENTISEEVTEPEEAAELVKLGEKMIEYCAKNGGAGLAAVQVGVPKRMFVWLNTPSTFQIVFNTKYFPEGKKTNVVEGCLTYPERFFHTRRYKRITARFQTFHESKFINVTKHPVGEQAFIFQHETDHFDGKTLVTEGIEIHGKD